MYPHAHTTATFAAPRGGASRTSGRPFGARKERGIALVLVLWLTIMMTVIASGFAFSMRNEVLAARNELSYASDDIRLILKITAEKNKYARHAKIKVR